MKFCAEMQKYAIFVAGVTLCALIAKNLGFLEVNN